MILLDVEAAQKAIKDLSETSATLITWCLSLIGGSLLAIISTSYVKPENKRIKLIYLFFLPGWVSVGTSIFYGEFIQRENFVVDINNTPKAITTVFENINGWYASQIFWFNIGLVCFVAWLISYFIWWIFKS